MLEPALHRVCMELVDRFGLSVCYNNVKRFAQGLRRVDPEQFYRLEYAPGEGAPTRHPKAGATGTI